MKISQEFFKATTVSLPEKGRLELVEGAMSSVSNLFFQLLLRRSSLHTAASTPNAHSETVEALVEAGSDVNAKDLFEITPLNLAAIYHNKNVIEVLLKYKADVNIPEWIGKTPLHNAAFSLANCRDLVQYKRDLLIVERLLENGAHVNSLTRFHETPLMSAVQGLHLGIIKKLLLEGADVHVRNEEFQTCLHVASSSRNFNRNIYLELLRHGACTECFDENGKTVLDIILQSEKEEAKAFIKAAILVNMGQWTEFSLDERNDGLSEFKQECVKEVDRMKSIQLSQNVSLCDFTLRSENENNFFDRVLTMLTNFPIYNDFIEARFQRSYLCGKMSEMKVYAIKKRGEDYSEVELTRDDIFPICSFLEDKDLLKFLKTFAEHFI